MRQSKSAAPQPATGLESARAASAPDRLGQSPRMLAQRRQIRALFGPAAPVQLAKLNIRGPSSGSPGTISGISGWINRPPSNLSKQGQHLTAYVTFVQTMLSRVRDRTPRQAAAELRNVINEFRQLPAMQNVNQWNNHIHQSLNAIDGQLQGAAGMSESDAADVVGDQIDALLRERNRVPGTAISEPGTVGHGEAKHAGALETMETALRTGNAGHYGNAEKAQAVSDMWALLDYDPPDPPGALQLQAIVARVATHLRSLRTAFPQVFIWLSGDPNYWLLPYLRANPHIATSLQRVSGPNLLLVQNAVHASL